MDAVSLIPGRGDDMIAAEIVAELLDAELKHPLPSFKDKCDLVAAHVSRVWNQGFRAGTLQRLADLP